MASVETVKVSVVTDRSPNVVPCSSTFTAEELCILLCKKYNIPPLTRTLFALRVKGTDYFLKDNCLVLASSRDYELRIRFKVSTSLSSFSSTYFKQCIKYLLVVNSESSPTLFVTFKFYNIKLD